MASITKKRAEREIAKLESGIPVDEEDIKHSVNIPFKEIEVEKIEKIGDQKVKGVRKSTRRTKREKNKKLINNNKPKKSTANKTRTPKETKLKKGEKIIKVGNRKIKIEKPRIKAIKTGGHILIITEKPQAALKIASALGNERKYSDDGIPYYEVERDGEKIVVAAAVGHLFSVNQKPGETGFPIFELEWIPSYLKKAEFTKKYYFTLLRLCKDAKEFIVASVDYNELTPVVENGEMKIIRIGELVEDILKDRKSASDIKIPCFDEKGIIKFKKLKNAIKHKIKENLYELSLDYGRKVKLTSSHNIFILKNNKIKTIKTADLKKGDKILCPVMLPLTQNKKEINLLDLRIFDNKREIFVEGADIAKILKRRVLEKARKECYLNDERVMLTEKGVRILKRVRIKKGYSTAKIAKKAGISQSLVVMWENKIKNPTLNNLVRYLSCLGSNPSKFIDNFRYCKIKLSSFQNLLQHVYKNQYKNFSNLNRATINIRSLREDETQKIKEAFIYGSKNKRNKLPIKLKVSNELVRVLGYYLAEGDLNNNYRIRFSLGLEDYGHEKKIIDEIKTFCVKYGISHHFYWHKSTRQQIVTIDNSVLALLFKEYFNFGNKANNKRIPSIIFNLPLSLKIEFLRAYFLGDGSISKGSITFNTASENLSSDISYLLLQLGVVAGISKSKGKASKSKNFIWKVSVTNSNDLMKTKKIWKDHHNSQILRLTKNSIKKRGIENFGSLSLMKIKQIKTVESSSDYVYDLSVEGENFIAGQGGVCCHNTDYDIEGEVIGLNVVRFICEQKDAERMKFSSLTKNELEKAYLERSRSLDWGQAIAGETRHYLDWMYGINLSRALMHAIKAAGAFRIMSIGRVQGPALALVVGKELEIRKFKPSPYWQIFVLVEGVLLKYIKDIVKKAELDKFKDLKGKLGIAETKIEQEHIMPPAPFDLTTLQTEAYRFFGINPARTLQIAQNLYLQGIISYPRTSSQKIPNVIDVKNIFRKLSNNYGKEVEMAIRIKPVEGGKSDPAHPSIYPTGEQASLTGEQEKIYDLIVRRFISCFCEDAIVENKKINFEVEGLRFLAKGLQVKKKAWMNVYKAKMKEEKLKDLNGEYRVDEVKIEEKETQPPKRYTPASLVRELEKRNMGTKSTRSSIIETLYNRGYVKGQSIEATELGISLISTLKKHSPIIIDEKLTRQFEKEIDAIQSSKHGLQEKEKKVLDEAKSAITKISERFKKEDKEIGGELVKANNKHVEKLREENIIMPCPVCGKGKLRISYGKKYGRYFVACNAYPKCKTTFSLPPNGLIKTTDKICEKCGFPMLMRISKGRRPWIFCFNEKNHPDFKGFFRNRKIPKKE